jgi:hypothetical protein
LFLSCSLQNKLNKVFQKKIIHFALFCFERKYVLFLHFSHGIAEAFPPMQQMQKERRYDNVLEKQNKTKQKRATN